MLLGMTTSPCADDLIGFIPFNPNNAQFSSPPKFCFPIFRTRKQPLTVTKSKTIHCWENGIKVEFAQHLPNTAHHIQSPAVKFKAFDSNEIVPNNSESLDIAPKVFENILKPTLPMYAALIWSHCRLEQWQQLFAAFGSMIDHGVLPDKYLIPTFLKSCSSKQYLKAGKMIHGYVLRNGVEFDVYIGNALIDFYSNCGNLRASVDVFNTMKLKDVVSWTALISAYMDEGLLDEAMNIFNSTLLSGIKPDLIFWNALIYGFAQNGEIVLALQLLENVQQKGLKPHASSWNGIISGCIQNGFFEDALDVFHDMLCSPEVPNSVTIASILPACAGLKDLDLGRAVHGYALKNFSGGNYHVEGSLIDMYSKCHRIDYAEKVFSKVENKSIVVWNEIIAAYVDDGNMEKAKEYQGLMRNEGLNPDLITYNLFLAGHARYGQKNEVYRLLSEMAQMGLEPMIITWNILISAFQQSGLSYEALKVFRKLQHDIFSGLPRGSARTNSSTIISALAASAELNLWSCGKEIHGYALKTGLESDIHVSSALVDMYMKSKDMESTTTMFGRTTEMNKVVE